MEWIALILWLLIGLILGAIAGLQFNNVLRYLSAGVAGAMLGGYLLTFFGIEFPFAQAIVREMVSGTIGGTVAILVVKFLE